MNNFKEIVWHHPKTGHFYGIIDFGLREENLLIQVAYRRRDERTGELKPPTFYRDPEVFFDGRFRMVEDQDYEEDRPAKRGKRPRPDSGIAMPYDVNGELIEPGDMVSLAAGYRETDKLFGPDARRVDEVFGDTLEFDPGPNGFGGSIVVKSRTVFKVKVSDREPDRKAGSDVGES